MKKLIPILLIFLGCQAENAKVYPTEYLLQERDLVPEGIDYSAKNDVFYLTSVAKSKIIEVDRLTGKQSNFIEENEYGYSPGVGIYVDDNRGHLHAIGGYYMSKDSFSSLYTFDINSKELLKRYNLSAKHFLNDLILDDHGTIYLTDSKDASVYRLRPESDTLELFLKSPEIDFPNGITISDDNTKLYVASSSKGVRVLDIATKTILNESDSLGVSQGIDGLEFYKNNLYGIQNAKSGNPFNFRKLILNKSQDAILDIKIIDSDPPNLDVPLTFCFAGKEAVVIGNSNLQHLDQVTFEFKDSESVLNTKLLVYKIE